MHTNILKISYIIAGLCSLLAVFFASEIYDDIANWYAPMTRAFINGDLHNALNANVPTLNVTIAGIIGKILPIAPFTALVLVGCLFYIATIPLVYYICNYILKNKNKAAIGALLYAIAPQIIRYSVNGLLNSGKNFFLTLCVALLFWIYQKNTLYKNILLGIAFSLLAMSRAECAVFLPFFGLAYLIILVKRYLEKEPEDTEKESKKNTLLMLFLSIALVVVSFFSVSYPKLHSVYKQTNIPSFDFRQSEAIGKIIKVKTVRPPDFFVNDSGLADRNVGKQKIAKSNSFNGVFKAVASGSYQLYLIFAIIGLAFLIKCKRFSQRYFWLVVLSFINFFIIIMAANSSRYYSINTILLMPLTVSGLYYVAGFLGSIKKLNLLWNNKKNIRYIIFIGLFAIGSGQVFNGMKKTFSTRDKDQCLAGKWLASEYARKPHSKKYKLLSTSSQVAFYSGIDRFYSLPYSTEEILTANMNKLKDYGFIAVRNRKNDKLLTFLKKQAWLKVEFDSKVTLFRNKDL